MSRLERTHCGPNGIRQTISVLLRQVAGLEKMLNIARGERDEAWKANRELSARMRVNK